jgi:hypothetical protein
MGHWIATKVVVSFLQYGYIDPKILKKLILDNEKRCSMNTSTEKVLIRFSDLEKVLIQEYINISRYELWLVQAHMMFAFSKFEFYIPMQKRKPKVKIKKVSPFDRAKNNLKKYFSYPLSSKFVHDFKKDKKDKKKETISESSWHRVVRDEKKGTKVQNSVPDSGQLGAIVVHAAYFISEKDQFEKNIQMKRRKTAMLILMERYSGYMQAVMLRSDHGSIKVNDLINYITDIKKRFNRISVQIKNVTFVSTDHEGKEVSTACHKTVDELEVLLREHGITDDQKVNFQKELVFDRANVIDFKRSSFLKDQFLELKKRYKKKFGNFNDLKSVFQMQEALLKSGDVLDLELPWDKYCLKAVKKKKAGKGNTIEIEDIVKNSNKAIILKRPKKEKDESKGKDDAKGANINLTSYLIRHLDKYNLGSAYNRALPVYILREFYKKIIPEGQRMDFDTFKDLLSAG